MNIDRFKFHLTTPNVLNPFFDTCNYTEFVTYQDVVDKVLSFPDKIRTTLKSNISTKYILDIITNKLNVPFHKLLEYSYIKCSKSILIAPDALYKIKRDRTTYKQIKEYYNVYLIESQNINSILTNVIKILLSEQYPEIFNNSIFTKVVPKYKSDTLFKKINENMTISDLCHSLSYTDETDYTIRDIIDVFNGNANINDTKLESLFHIYYDKYWGISIFLILDEDKSISLRIPIVALYIKNWSLIENQYVYNIGRTDIPEGVYSGIQKNAWYFNHQLVLELKKYFK